MSNIKIGIDFSINKPCSCILKDNKISFISWPYNLSESHLKVYSDTPIKIIKRTDVKEKARSITEKVRFEIQNSKYLAHLILDELRSYLNKETLVAFESLSYGSKGDIILQLSSYKSILMQYLSEIVPIENIFNFSPITIKKTSGCSKRGMTKSDMIDVFKTKLNPFSSYLKEHEEEFKTRGGKWLPHLDDISDSYFVLETLLNYCSNTLS